MRHSNTLCNIGIMELGRMVIRPLQCAKNWHNGLLRGKEAWPMKFHYLMWAAMGFLVLATSVLYHGQQDVLDHETYIKGEAAVFSGMSMKQLTEFKI